MRTRVNWILVPIDFSEESRLALEAADRQTPVWGSGLLLLHVQKPAELARARLTMATVPIERWIEKVRYTPQQRVAWMTCKGDPGEKILEIAAQFQPRKIVMGRGGHGGQPGGVTDAVARGFPGVVQVVSKKRTDVYLRANAA